MKPLVRTVPRARFAHGENDLACFFIEAEKIDHCRIGDTGLNLIMIVLLILRHWAE